MKRFEHLGLWAMLRDTESVTDGSAQSEAVIEEFATELYNYCESENNLPERMRVLKSIVNKLKITLERPSCGEHLSAIIKEAILYTEDELDILKVEMEYKVKIALPCGPGTKNPIIIRWNGTVAELLEYMIPLYLADKLAKPTGEPMTWAGVIQHIKEVYGITVPDLYDRKSKILSRYKNTAFIDKMRQVMVDASQK